MCISPPIVADSVVSVAVYTSSRAYLVVIKVTIVLPG